MLMAMITLIHKISKFIYFILLFVILARVIPRPEYYLSYEVARSINNLIFDDVNADTMYDTFFYITLMTVLSPSGVLYIATIKLFKIIRWGWGFISSIFPSYHAEYQWEICNLCSFASSCFSVEISCDFYNDSAFLGLKQNSWQVSVCCGAVYAILSVSLLAASRKTLYAGSNSFVLWIKTCKWCLIFWTKWCIKQISLMIKPNRCR